MQWALVSGAWWVSSLHNLRHQDILHVKSAYKGGMRGKYFLHFVSFDGNSVEETPGREGNLWHPALKR